MSLLLLRHCCLADPEVLVVALAGLSCRTAVALPGAVHTLAVELWWAGVALTSALAVVVDLFAGRGTCVYPKKQRAKGARKAKGSVST